MNWNWTQKDWGDFRYDSAKLLDIENRFLRESGVLTGAFKHLNEQQQQAVTIDLISDEALKTSEIEGEYLNRDSLQASIRRQFGLETSAVKITPSEQGIAEMTVDLYERHNEPLEHETLYRWHKMLLQGRADLKNLGGYRTHKEPMQIVSGAIHKPKVHFEAPPSAQMPSEMDKFISWFNESRGKLPMLTRAGIAHHYFLSIHPFEDGNGRIGRAISEKVMSEELGNPTLIALAYTIEANKKAYYDALQKTNTTNEITDWLLYFAETIFEAQQTTMRRIEFIISKAKFYDRFDGQINERQRKVIDRIFKAGADGFVGGLSANNYITIAKTSATTATRDLADLVAKGAFSKTGVLKHTRYTLVLDG